MTIALETEHLAYPPPIYEWTLNGEVLQNDSERTFTYPKVIFHKILRSHGGRYVLTANNSAMNKQGSAWGEFSLIVLCKRLARFS